MRAPQQGGEKINNSVYTNPYHKKPSVGERNEGSCSTSGRDLKAPPGKQQQQQQQQQQQRTKQHECNERVF